MAGEVCIVDEIRRGRHLGRMYLQPRAGVIGQKRALQGIEQDRLAHHRVEAGARHQRAAALGHVRRDRDDAGLAIRSVRRNERCGLEPVDPRHVQVHQDGIERSTARKADRRLAIRRDRRPMAEAAQQRRPDLPVDRVVIDQQYGERFAPARSA